MQRYVRLFGTPITLLLLLGILLYGAWWGKKNLLAPIPPKSPTPCTTQKASTLATSKVTVKVYNGGTQVGLASQVGQQLTAAGFKVAGVGNTDSTVTTTVIVGAKVTDPEVKLVLGFFKGAKAKADGRVDHTVDVLVGSSYGGMNTAAAKSIAVAGGTVCLPSSASSGS